MIQDKHNKMTDYFFQNLETEIEAKYHRYLIDVGKMNCKLQKKPVSLLGRSVCHISRSSLRSACVEMRDDIRCLLLRRGKLLNALKPSYGKIAGIIAYRLAKNQIIHLCEGCASCLEQCPASKLNGIFALRCAWEYIDIKYGQVNEDIRKELMYSFSSRHVNQETLGLVFDTIQTAYYSQNQQPASKAGVTKSH
jgi:ferredoxin